MRLMRRWIWFWSLCLTACAAPVLTDAPAPTVTLLGAPFRPAPAASAPPLATPIIIASPTPSATPVTHSIQSGETLIEVAVTYGVSLEALQQANPGVLPEMLSIGTVLVIPLSAEAGPAAPAGQPTPLPVILGVPVCFDLAGGGRYCLVEARNPGAAALEAVTARVTLADAAGRPLADAVAQPAINVLAPGAAAPLVAYFAAAPAGVAAVGVTPVLALPLADPAARYPVLEWTVESAALAAPAARLAGVVRNPTAAPARARLAAAVYDAAGGLLGSSWVTWDGALAAGETRAFTVTVAVLGAGPVDHYQFWAEGQP